MSRENSFDLTSEISAVAGIDVNPTNHFMHVENPKGWKCIHCDSFWKALTTTTMKAQLSNVKFAKEYEIRLYSRVPPDISAAMVSKLQEVEGKKGKKRNFTERVLEDMCFEMAEIAKRQKGGNIEESINNAARILADQKVAHYVFITRQSFNSCNSLA